MATLAATEPVICPNALAAAAAESGVPTCMFAPERLGEDEPRGADGFEGCDGTNGDPAEPLDLSSKVGLTATASCYASTAARFPLELYVLWRLEDLACASVAVPVLKVKIVFSAGCSAYCTVTRM